MRSILTILPVAACGLLATVSDSVANGINYLVSYSGFDVIEDSHFVYSGATVALNSDNSPSGFVLQGFAGFGGYTYQTPGVPGGTVDGDATWLRAMVGYQTYAKDTRFASMAGSIGRTTNSVHRIRAIPWPEA
jgi:hypothetical protein